MHRAPAVSVVMAVYNEEKRIASAIQSVISQDMADWELVVVDDGSTDGTKQAVARFADPRVHLIALNRNSGLGAARNVGLRAARGEWVTFLDGDDQFEIDRLSTMLAVGRQTGCDVVADNELIVDGGSGAVLGYTFGQAGNRGEEWHLSLDEFLRQCPVMKPMIRLDFVREHGLAFPEGREYLEDLHLWIEILLEGADWVCISKPLYRYVQRSGSLSHRRVELHRRRARSLCELAGLAEKRGFLREGERIRALARDADLASKTWEIIEAVRGGHLKDAVCLATSRPAVFAGALATTARWVGTRAKRLVSSLKR